MKIPELRWPTEPQPYDEDLLVDVQAGSVVLLIRGRNAWHSTWVRHYLRNATLYTDLQSAKHGAESQRGPGNVFYIVEAPALLLSGQRSKVVLCDAHPDNPFGAFRGFASAVRESPDGAWIDGIFPGVSVRDAVIAFGHRSGHWAGPTPSEHSLRTGMLDTVNLFDAKRHPLQSLVSRPIGSNYYLQWDPNSSGNRYTRRGANAVAKRWTEVAVEATKGHAQVEDKARELQRHRDDVLKAMPKSQWLVEKARVDAEKREAKQAAFERWSEVSDSVSELEEALWEAEAEQDDARMARMKPESTSAGIRKQRERVEAATAEVERLTAALAEAESNAEALWVLYSQS
ncbi:hypothetical protein [Nocardioides taihuensis]|uniref:Uncharacterized protein n=1 Tax=Nocardioides taihuensis TaxID=1835606 RepID=A0ABW0BCZ6_9ACTN